MIRIGIIGGAGYTAGELIPACCSPTRRPESSSSTARATRATARRRNNGDWRATPKPGLSDAYRTSSHDVLFLLFGTARAANGWGGEHGARRRGHRPRAGFPRRERRVRLGSPELNRDRIRGTARHQAGCFATAIQLALLPLAAAGLLTGEVHVTAVTGSTGAGVKPSATTHFSWRSDNISVYKAFTHQHLVEIGRNLRQLEPSFDQAVNFVPMRGDFTRGILASVYTACPLDEEAARKLYADYYAAAAFTHATTRNIDLKQVVNTNKALVGVSKYGDKLHIVSVIDNLLKGASGQAVQNMNLMFGLDETAGLRLKASAF